MPTRIIAIILCVLMVISMIPSQAFATEEVSYPTEQITETYADVEIPSEEAPSGSAEETSAPTDVETAPSEEAEPSKEETAPTEVEAEPSEEATAPTEVEAEPSEEATAPTEEVEAEPSEETTAPTEAEPTIPTETVTAFTEDSALSANAMEDTGFLTTDTSAVQIEPFDNTVMLSAVISAEGDTAEFLFTPETTAVYEFRSLNFNIATVGTILDSDGAELSRDSAENGFLIYEELEAGKTYTLTAAYAEDSHWGDFIVFLTRTVDLSTDTLMEADIREGSDGTTYFFIPEVSGTYDFHMNAGEDRGRAWIYDSSRKTLASNSKYRDLTLSCEMTAGEIYTIKAAFYSSGTTGLISSYLSYVPELKIDEKAEIATLLDDHNVGFTFTSPETSIYNFSGRRIYDIHGNSVTVNSREDTFDIQSLVNANETYTNSVSHMLAGIYEVTVSKVPILTGATVLNSADTTAVFQIVPEQTDCYTISAEADYNVTLDLRSIETGFDARGYGTKAKITKTLEAGVVYILTVDCEGNTGTVSLEMFTSHAYEEESSVIAPTCTTPGQRIFTCIHCGEEITEEIPPAHEYDNGACIHCNDLYIVELYPDSYNVYTAEFSNWNVDKAYFSYTPKYTESYTFWSSTGGDTVGYLYDSNWNLLTTNDDDEDGNPDFVITYTLEAGKTYYLVSEIFTDGVDTGFAIELSVNHDYEIVTDPGTCTKNGKAYCTCKICGYKTTKTIYNRHTWDEGIVTKEYSCDVQGSATYTCTICGESQIRAEGGNGHVYDNSIYCTKCNKIMEEEGTCGDHLIWKVNSDLTLTISGTGDMYNYGSWENESPWSEYRDMIQKVMIAEGVTSVGSYAFYSCSNVTNVSLPETLQKIQEGAFMYCGCQTIQIPAAVSYIAPNAFFSFEHTVDLEIHKNNQNYSTYGAGVLCNKEKTILYSVFKHSNSYFRIPNGIVTIAANALQEEAISCLIIPASVQTIEDQAIADGMNYDGFIMFEGDAPSFGENAFAEGYGYSAFDGIAYYPGDNATWTEDILQDYGGAPQWVPFSNVLANGTCGTDLEWTLRSNGTLTITGSGPMDNFGSDYETDTYIDQPWEDYCKLIQNVILPDGLTRIGNQAFEECTALQTIQIPDSVTHIGDNAFFGCTALQEIVIPGSVTHIGDHAFEKCESLVEIELPISVQNLGYGVFLDCESLVRAKLPDGITTIPGTLFGRCRSLTEVNIPSSVTRIESAAFSNCNSLERIELPEGITFIGYWAFQHCYNLTEINIPSALKSIDGKAFRDCRKLTKVDLPEGLVSIADGAFYDCTSLTEITIPSTVKKIGWGAFSGCTKLTEVTIPEGVSYLGGTFCGCTNLTSVTIPNSVTNIAYWAFRDCTSLKEVQMPEKLKSIGYAVFADSAIDSIEFSGDAPVFTPVTGAVDNNYYSSSTGTFSGATASASYPSENTTWTDQVLSGNYGGTITWVPYGTVKNRVSIDTAELMGQISVWIDGKEYAVTQNGETSYVDLPDGNAKTLVVHTYHVGNAADVHTQYPVGMKVWMLTNENDYYTATRQEEFDNILQYSGMSIRVYGRKGIRMITSIEKNKKNALISDGLAGYTLKEYGTAIAWSKQLSGSRPLVLGRSYVKSNYAYKKGIADPVFKYTGNLMQYTNVLVNFENEQCKDDIAMRPYMILEDENGEQVTLYGGIVNRSIGYIACQNRNVFEPGSDEYEYVWEIIKYVYGSKYDDEYKVVWSPSVM